MATLRAIKRALTIPGMRIAAWWVDHGAATPADLQAPGFLLGLQPVGVDAVVLEAAQVIGCLREHLRHRHGPSGSR
jgi:hypothetical protein